MANAKAKFYELSPFGVSTHVTGTSSPTYSIKPAAPLGSEDNPAPVTVTYRERRPAQPRSRGARILDRNIAVTQK